MNNFTRLIALAPVLCLGLCCVLCGCGDDDDDSSDDDADDDTDGVNDDTDDDNDDDDSVDDDTSPPVEECESGKRFEYSLIDGAVDIPFPTDFYTVNNAKSPTGIRIDLPEQITKYIDRYTDVLGFIRHDMNKLDGFGTITPVLFPTSAKPMQSMLPDTNDPDENDTVFCTVIDDEDHPHAGEFWPIQVFWSEGPGLLKADPYFPFHENTTYCCVVRSSLQTDEGECYERSAHLRYILRDEPNPDNPDAELLEPYRQRIAPTLNAFFEQVDIERHEVVSATVFTTQYVTWDMMHVRQQLEDMAAASLPEVDGDWVRLDTSHTNLDSVWEIEYDTVEWRHNRQFAYDEDFIPVANGTDRVMLRLNLPDASTLTYQQPYPVVIMGHGINSSRGESTSNANILAPYGFATVGIDFLEHGFRDDGADIVLAMLRIFDVLHPLRFRDYFKQNAADIIWLKHLIRGLSELDLLPYETGGDGVPDLDTSRIFYVGNSWGSLHAPIIAAVEPDIEGYVLNVGAVDLLSVALDGPIGMMILDVVGLLDSILNLSLEDSFMVLFDLEFHMVGGGDSLSYTPYVFDHPLYDPPGPIKNILHQMASEDETLGGPACAAMARNLGLTLMEPYPYYIDTLDTTLPPFDGSGTYMYDTSSHTIMYNGDEIGDGVRQQAGNYLRSCLENGIGTIIAPFGK